MSGITDAIAAAKAAASEVAAAPPANLPAGTGPGAGLPSAVSGKKLSMDDLQGAMSVGKWIKITEDGLKFGDNAELVSKPVPVIFTAIDNVGFTPKFSIKWGNPATYKSSYDGVTTFGGGPWEQTIRMAQAQDPRANPYRSCDLPFVLLEDVISDKGNKVAFAGETVGNSLSTTNWGEWENFWKLVKYRDYVGKELIVNLGSAPRKNKAGNTWGVLTMQLVGPFEGEKPVYVPGT